MGKTTSFLSSFGKILGRSARFASEVPLANPAARIGLGVINSYLAGVVPEKVDKAIQERIQNSQTELEGDWAKLISNISIVMSFLLGISVFGCLYLYFGEPSLDLSRVFIAVIYAIPFLATAFAFAGVGLILTRVVTLEERIKKSLEEGIEQSGAIQSGLVKFYESRSIDQLAEGAAGKVIFALFTSVRSGRKTWIYPLACLALNYSCLLCAVLIEVSRRN
jgi:hypothetical protein